jgi:hypothetical protein
MRLSKLSGTLPDLSSWPPSSACVPLVAHCHLGLGRPYRRTGDQAKAEEHLTTARAMYQEMDMRFWLEKAETELGGVER